MTPTISKNLVDKFEQAILEDACFRRIYDAASHLDNDNECPTMWGNLHAYIDIKKDDWLEEHAEEYLRDGCDEDATLRACVGEAVKELLDVIEYHYGL